MTFSRFFKLVLSLPLILGGLALGVVQLQVPVPQFVLPVVGFLAFGVLYFGPRYALFAVIVIAWSWSRTEQTLRRSTLVLPVAFVPFMFIQFPGPHGPRPPIEWDALISQTASDSLVTVVTGYVFVILAWVLYGLLSLAGRRRNA